MMVSNGQVRLTDVSQQLGIDYTKLYRAVICGEVPAERDAGGTRWVIKEVDLPKIREAFER